MEANTNDDFTLRIDPQTRDIVFDEDGMLETISGDEATAQAVRQTLLVYKGEFPLVPSHGTDYEKIMGKKPNELEDDEVPEVIREGVFQEPEVTEVDGVEFNIAGRSMDISVSGRLASGNTITSEVSV